MKKFLFLIPVGLLLLFSGFQCGKDVEGCTDPASINFNPDATLEDGSCVYPSDQFVGTYTTTETVTRYNAPNDLDTVFTRTSTFSVTRIDNNLVRVTGFGNGCDINAFADQFTLTLHDPESSNISTFVGQFNAPTLGYSYLQFYANGSSNYDLIEGQATKH